MTGRASRPSSSVLTRTLARGDERSRPLFNRELSARGQDRDASSLIKHTTRPPRGKHGSRASVTVPSSARRLPETHRIAPERIERIKQIVRAQRSARLSRGPAARRRKLRACAQHIRAHDRIPQRARGCMFRH
jgi:hypothetical protein